MASVLGFHGTASNFDKLDDRLTFFAQDVETAAGYARRAGPEGKVIQALLTIERPKVLDFLAPNTPGWYKRKRQTLIGQGYDGMIIGGNVFVVFWARQITEVQTIQASA